MPSILYTNRRGYDVHTHSYSAGQDFKSCHRLYELKRVHGWKEKEKRAATFFGEAIEAAVQFFHNNGCQPQSAAPQFQLLWSQHKDAAFAYTDREGSWEDMYKMGTDMMVLYEVKLPSLPIHNPKFQLNYRKPVFPGTELADIEFTSFIDMLSEDGDQKLIIDIKTTGAALPDVPGILGLDPQLRTYAWVTGVPDVAFLYFLKVRPGLRAGDEVTLLADTTLFKAGDTAVIAEFMSSLGRDGDVVQLLRPADFTRYQEALKGVRGKNREALRKILRSQIPMEGVWPGVVTKQVLQFATAQISPEVIKQTGDDIGRQIVDIVHAHETGDYLQTGAGIRFPNNRCVTCQMLGICTNNKELRDTSLEQINRTWIDDLEEGE